MEMQDVGGLFMTTLAGNLVIRKNSNDNDQHSLSACCIRDTALACNYSVCLHNTYEVDYIMN